MSWVKVFNQEESPFWNTYEALLPVKKISGPLRFYLFYLFNVFQVLALHLYDDF